MTKKVGVIVEVTMPDGVPRKQSRGGAWRYYRALGNREE